MTRPDDGEGLRDYLGKYEQEIEIQALCQPASDLPEGSSAEGLGWRDPAIEALFKDEQFAIYRAVAQLKGRSRDVMSLRALGLNDVEIRAELNMTPTNYSTALSRARRELRGILHVGDDDDGRES